MPNITILEMPPQEQAQMLVALRRARYGYLLALQVLLLGAAKRTPSEIAACLFCSRSSVYRSGTAYRTGTLGLERAADGPIGTPVRTTVPDPVPEAVARGAAQGGTAHLGVVPPALELCHPRHDLTRKAWAHGLGGDGAALGPRSGLGVEAGQACGARQ